MDDEKACLGGYGEDRFLGEVEVVAALEPGGGNELGDALVEALTKFLRQAGIEREVFFEKGDPFFFENRMDRFPAAEEVFDFLPNHGGMLGASDPVGKVTESSL